MPVSYCFFESQASKAMKYNFRLRNRMTEIPDREHKLMVFTGIERARFRRPVVPGDQLRIEVEVKAWRENSGRAAVRMEGIAYVGEKRVAEAIVTCQLVDRARGRSSAQQSEPE